MTSRLASLLVQDGHVPARRMAEAFQRQVIYGGTLDTILLEMGLVDEELAREYLSRATELPVIAAQAAPPADGATWFSQALAERFHAVPMGKRDGRAMVMVTDAPEREQLRELEVALTLEIEPRIGLEYRLHQAIEQLYGVPIPPRFASLARRLQQRGDAPARARKAAAPRDVRVLEAEPDDEEERRSDAQAHDATVEAGRSAPPQAIPQPVIDPVSPARDPVAAPPVFSDFDVRPPTGPGPVSALSHDAGMKLLREADHKDVIFQTLCRMGRDRFAFAALFTMQGKSASVAMALSDSWVSHDVLLHVSVPLTDPSSLRAAVNGRAPYLGRIDDDPPMSQAMAMLGRPAKLWAALLPVVIRDRAVAVLHVDDEGKPRDSGELVELIAATTEASQAFQRLILKAKADKLQKTPAAPVAEAAVEFQGRANLPAPVDELRKRPSSDGGDEETDPGFKRALRDPARSEEIARALSVVEQGGPVSVTAAEALLAMGEEAVRSVALRLPGNGSPDLAALVPRFGEAIVPHLLPRLADPSPEVRLAVAHALAELRPQAAIAPLAGRLFDSDRAVRRAAVAALSRYPPSKEVRAIVESLRADLPGPDVGRQRDAAYALGELRDAPSVPRLVELVKHRDAEVVEVARHALIQISKQDFGTSRWRWRSWWERNREHSRVEWLLAGLTHRDADVRASASGELETITTETFAFHVELPKRDREEARQKWLVWFKQNPVRQKERTR